MKISVGMTTYGRPEQYARTIAELRRALAKHDVRVVVVQDGGERYVTDMADNFRFQVDTTWQENKGKQRYWETVNKVLKGCILHLPQLHLQLPDDLNYGPGWWEELEDRVLAMEEPFAMNVLPDHRSMCWRQRHFVDGAFVADREAMNELGWTIYPVPIYRWNNDPSLSSGVWKQVTKRWGALDILKPRLNLPITHEWLAELSRMNPDRAWCQ